MAVPLLPDERVTRLLCPAKVNLHLRVGPRRRDGFHPLLSWMCTVGLFDTLTLHTRPIGTGAAAPLPPSGERPAGVAGGIGVGAGPHGQRAGAGSAGDAGDAIDRLVRGIGAASDAAVSVTLTSDSADLPCDERNLVVRIAAAWGRAVLAGDAFAMSVGTPDATAGTGKAGRVGGTRATATHECGDVGAGTAGGTFAAHEAPRLATTPHLRARLEKRIPVGAGLGGGDSDAARTLLALSRLWPALGRVRGVAEAVSADDLSAFAARFGSDLPFFLHGPSSVCAGRGEVVRPIAPPRARWAVLVLPGIVMPTADVYRRFDEMGLGRDRDVTEEPDWAAWTTLGAVALLPRLVNDLEAPAFALRPDLNELRGAIEALLARPVRMSGSGSSVFTLYDSRGEAGAAGASVRARHGLRVEVVEVAPHIEDDLTREGANETLSGISV